MKSEYGGGMMLCFVQGFDGQQPSIKETREANNNVMPGGPSRSRPPLKKLLVQIPESEKSHEENVHRVSQLQGAKTAAVRSSKRHFPEVKRSFSDRFIIADSFGKKTIKAPTLIRKTRSSGNFASLPSVAGGGSARSAPATPVQEGGPGALPPSVANNSACQTQQHFSPHRRSPHHHYAQKSDNRSGVKQLSHSSPSVSLSVGGVAAGGHGSEEAGLPVAAHKPSSQPSKARQKKFLRNFPQVAPDERVLNYYSCALVGDILLQGHLYITKNYFAFYSNVFGYVTKLLIPTASVLRVSKEKMARIIPNAVGVVTDDERHVFGSLLSRDSTYRLMLQVWKEANMLHNVVPIQGKELRVSEAELDASEYSMDEETSSGGEGPIDSIIVVPGDGSGSVEDSLSQGPSSVASELRRRKAGTVDSILLRKSSTTRNNPQTVRSTIFSRMATVGVATLVILLVAMAVVFIWQLFHHHSSHLHNGLEERLHLLTREDMYTEILRWQSQLHRKSANEVNDFLETNLDQIAKVRQSLEALSALMVTDRREKIEHHEELPAPTSKSAEQHGLVIEKVNS